VSITHFHYISFLFVGSRSITWFGYRLWIILKFLSFSSLLLLSPHSSYVCVFVLVLVLVSSFLVHVSLSVCVSVFVGVLCCPCVGVSCGGGGG